MKKIEYIKPESIVVLVYTNKGVMGFDDDFASMGTWDTFAREFDPHDEVDKKWGFGPEDFAFKDVWETE